MLCRDVRTAAAVAMADFGVHPEGREILRREGAIRPLVQLLGEGLDSPAAEQAAKALMTLSASDINKVTVLTPCRKSQLLLIQATGISQVESDIGVYTLISKQQRAGFSCVCRVFAPMCQVSRGS